MKRMKSGQKRQRGTSLLEVLISVVILSLGLLGYAGLQSATIKNSHNAYLRTQATALAYNVLDRMRANRTNLGGYVMSYGGTPTAADAVAWKAELTATLPDGQAKITRDAATSEVVVTIKWHDNSTSVDSHEFSTGSRI
jgi:type IV pilus assembly protein PilV